MIMLSSYHNGDSCMAADAGLNGQRVRKRHRARHQKSRLGCFSCKSRRVKCDEVRPVCGSCSSRGEPCVFPNPPTTSLGPISSSRERRDMSRSWSGDSPNPIPSYLEAWETPTSRSGVSAPQAHVDLHMDDLLSMQFFHMHTAHEMSLNQKRSLVWQRMIPRLAGEHNYLMHLLIALGGIHLTTHRLRKRSGGDYNWGTVDLRSIMNHYQRGLQDFIKEIAKLSNVNVEAVYAGSLLLVAFVYASLQVPELHLASSTTELALPSDTPTLDKQTLPLIQRPEVKWLHLIRGVSTVIQGHWPALKSSSLRPMVLHFHGEEYWQDVPFNSSLPNLSHCSLPLQLFTQGAFQAITNLRAFHAILQFTDSSKLHLTETTSEGALEGQLRAIDVIQNIYSRVISVFQCTANEFGFPDDAEIQYNLEEAAVLNWPILAPDVFIGLLEDDGAANLAWGFSMTLLAHFYVVNALIDRWYLGAFKEEILRIQRSVFSLRDAELDRLLIWPVKIATS